MPSAQDGRHGCPLAQERWPAEPPGLVATAGRWRAARPKWDKAGRLLCQAAPRLQKRGHDALVVGNLRRAESRAQGPRPHAVTRQGLGAGSHQAVPSPRGRHGCPRSGIRPEREARSAGLPARRPQRPSRAKKPRCQAAPPPGAKGSHLAVPTPLGRHGCPLGCRCRGRHHRRQEGRLDHQTRWTPPRPAHPTAGTRGRRSGSADGAAARAR